MTRTIGSRTTMLVVLLVGFAASSLPRCASAEPRAGLQVGQPAPDFRAAASDGKTYALADLKGRVVVLYFYPKDDTPGCTVEAKGFQGEGTAFAAAGAVVLGVSRDDLESHHAFAGKYDLTFPLLVDADGAIHDAYGAWKEGSLFGRTALGVDRSTVVIDREGIVRKIWRSVSPDGHAAEVLAFVRSLPASGAAR
jgi:peroxiredoxin Q/BCP